MWRDETDKAQHSPGAGYSAHNRRALMAVALVVALALLLASPLPSALVPMAVENFVFYGAVGASILAVFRGDVMRAPHFTAWDQALMLLFVSQLAGLLVDAEAVKEAIEAHGGRP